MSPWCAGMVDGSHPDGFSFREMTEEKQSTSMYNDDKKMVILLRSDKVDWNRATE